jgi:hypothetical protein
MPNLNKLEKSKGVLLFAFNTEIDYISIAQNSAKLIDKHLKLPITLVTDTPELTSYCFDQIIKVDNTAINYKSAFDSSCWKNLDRYCAYALSPYHETLLLDVDYLVFDDSLLKLFESTYNYKILKRNYTPNTSWDFTMGTLSLPYMWATVVLFKKTDVSKQLFNLVGRIQQNYEYYRKLYNIREGNFRNDYAFTIADYILNGYSPNANSTICASMLTIDKNITSMEWNGNAIIIREENCAHVISKQNIHIVDKRYLVSENFKKFMDTM